MLQRFQKGHYAGNKWGGKFLRAPDIFFTILEKGKGKLVKLRDLLIIKAGIITGNNAKYYRKRDLKFDNKNYSLVFKSPREVNKIFLTSKDAKSIIKVKNVPFKIRKAKLLWVDLRGDKHICHYNSDYLPFEHNFYGLEPKDPKKDIIYTMILNSTLAYLFIEIFGRRGLGGGALRLVRIDLMNFPVLNPNKEGTIKRLHHIFYNIANREIKSIFEELGFDSDKPIREQEPNPLPDRAELDKIIFDELDLTEEERKEVYWAVAELVKQRLDKAKSLKKK